MEHLPVLLKEAVQFLVTNKSGVYVDGTVGCGGHSKEILQSLKSDGRLLGVDRDTDALEVAKKELEGLYSRNYMRLLIQAE